MTSRMRLVFAGTPEFARVALAQLHGAGFSIALVLTQPDRPAGRGLQLQPSAVKAFALAHGMAVAQPRGMRLDGKFASDALLARAAIEAARPDAMIVAAYGLILPPWALTVPRLGCINIHASLLPRWRGAAPVHRAIEFGDAQTGVTIMQMDAGLDTGAMLMVAPEPIHADDTTGRLHDRLAALGSRLVVETLHRAESNALRPTAQPADGATYAHKIDKSEAAIDWTVAADVIERRLRAFDPFPGATTLIGAVADPHQSPASGPSRQIVKCWHGVLAAGDGMPGEVLAVGDDGITVACGTGALRLTELQRPGGKRLTARQYLQGHPVAVGEVFGSRPT